MSERHPRLLLPFTAIVGQEQMKLALVLNAINPRIGGVLIRGEKGTAKSSAVRALAEVLPAQEVHVGCPYSCDPRRPDEWCERCRTAIPPPEAQRRPVRVVTLPIGATEDRLVGSIDLERAIAGGIRAFEPGLLAEAHRGVLFIDEVNLLDDHVVDVLLDSAAMGVNVVEREGISLSHPAKFILIGTMNPEEGDLRPQLLDRFALSVAVRGLEEPRQRMMILQRHIAFEEDPVAFHEQWLPQEQELGERITRARQVVDRITYTSRDLFTIATLTGALRIDGHRADLVILKTARAHAAFEGRTAVTERDILLAAELAIPHRLRRGPFQDAEISMAELEERVEQSSSEWQGDEVPIDPLEESTPVKKKAMR